MELNRNLCLKIFLVMIFMQVKIDYDTSKNFQQQLFHSCNAEEVVYGGAKGGGKTCALTMDAIAYGLIYPCSKIYLFRETYDNLEKNVIKEFKNRVPEKVKNFVLYRYNESKHYAKLFNGTEIRFRYISNEKTAKRYQGSEMNYVGIDELTNFKKEWIQILLSCMRSPQGYPVRFRATCNPGGIGHGWVKQDYIKATEYGTKSIIDSVTDNCRVFIPAKVTDNYHLMQNDPNYIKRLKNLPDILREAYLNGNWDVFEGQFFCEYNYNFHTIEPFNIPCEWKKFRSIDWGYNAPCCILWHTIAPDGHIYTYRELYINRTLASDVAKMILEASQLENIEYTVASPDAWNKSGLGDQLKGESIADTFGKNGVILTKADNNRINGWMRMREFMKIAPDGQPWWQIMRNCRNLIRTLPDMIFSSERLEDIADGLEDHCVESGRYGLMSRPKPFSFHIEPVFADPVEKANYDRLMKLKKNKSNA